jgi:phage tail-like protein
LTNGFEDGSAQPSSYLRYLPALYWKDAFIGRFLRIFEDVLSPVQATVSGLPGHFDPAITSPAMLSLLAGWLGAPDPQGIDDGARRRLIKSSLLLHRWRGTKQGMRLALEIATGHAPFITEYSQGLVLGGDAVLGLNTSLQGGVPLAFHIAFDCDESVIDQTSLNDTIQRYKPADVICTVSFRNEG